MHEQKETRCNPRIEGCKRKKNTEIQAEGNQSFVISTGRKQLFHIGELVGEGGEHGALV